MSFDFDVEAAIDQIATLEQAISTPTPGIVNSYGFGLNPQEFDDPADLPAIIHLELGPNTAAPGDIPGRVAMGGLHQLNYDIDSLAFLLEAVPGLYPADNAAVVGLWQPICDLFFSDATRRTLCTAASADVYACVFNQQSYQVRRWPLVGEEYKLYWSLRYTHRFTFTG